MSAPVFIRTLEGVTELNMARSVFDEVWPSDEGTQITPNLLQAMAHNGSYVSGAFVGDQIVAAAFAFPGVDEELHLHLHSHMAAVKKDFRNRNIGAAIKWHQRDWALERGYQTITWTFDPLVRRNARLNFIKLGVRVFEYFPNFYGDMPDALNAGDPSDRVIARWELSSARVVEASKGRLGFSADETPVALENEDGSPRKLKVDSDAKEILCYLPEDIVELRASNSELALRWRLALREELHPRLLSGWAITGFTQDGAYIVTNEAGVN